VVEHLVMFKFKVDVADSEMEAAAAGLRALKDKIPGVIHITAGKNFTERSQGHQMGLVVRLKDRDALATYAKHPEHVKVVETLIKPKIENVIAVDYEF
jgi:hypothetical protein